MAKEFVMSDITQHSETDKQVFFSIIIPSYNRPDSLRTCLQSIRDLKTGNTPMQIVVVNDGSTQPYEHVIQPFREKLDIAYVEQENQGPAAARNNGAQHATGQYLIFLDDDCAFSPNWLTTFKAAVSADVIVGGKTENCLKQNLFSQTSQVLVDYLYEYYNVDRKHASFLTSNNMIIPRAIFNKLGGFDMSFTDSAAEDRDFCDRLLHKGYRIVYQPEILIHHRHKMGFSGFVRQHFKYGCGANIYHQKRAHLNKQKLKVEPLRFYVNLILFPFKNKCPNTLLVSLFLFASQAVNAIGFFWAKFLHR